MEKAYNITWDAAKTRLSVTFNKWWQKQDVMEFFIGITHHEGSRSPISGIIIDMGELSAQNLYIKPAITTAMGFAHVKECRHCAVVVVDIEQQKLVEECENLSKHVKMVKKYFPSFTLANDWLDKETFPKV